MDAYRGVGKIPDEEERRRWQNPEAILADVGLRPGDTFIDIGCGEGFFSLPAARLVGQRGMVYGLDVNAKALGNLKEKADAAGLNNLSLTVGEGEKTILCGTCADIIFFGMVLHDFLEPAKVLMNARKMLKPGGRLINLDWKKEPMEVGPPSQVKFSQQVASRLVEAAGFKVETIKEAGPYHYLIIAGQ